MAQWPRVLAFHQCRGKRQAGLGFKAHRWRVDIHAWQQPGVEKPSQSRVRVVSMQRRGRGRDSRLLIYREIDHINLLKKMRARFLTVEEGTTNIGGEEGGKKLVVLNWNRRCWCELMHFKKYK